MTSIANGELGSTVRSKLNSSLTVTDAFSVSGGNVGIGTTSPSTKLMVVGDTGFDVRNAAQTDALGITASGGFSDFTLKGQTNAYRFFSGPASGTTERMRIDANGFLLVGTASIGGAGGVSFRLGSAGTVNMLFNRTSTTETSYPLEFQNGGVGVGNVAYNNSGTAYNTSSDYRLKENVAPMQNALDKIAQLNPVTYTWKADGSDGQGFIAHELQAVVPDCVTGEKDAVDDEGNPKYQGVDTSFLVATLVKAIQELKAEVDSLRAQLNP